jgi:hypothetical protein
VAWIPGMHHNTRPDTNFATVLEIWYLSLKVPLRLISGVVFLHGL